MDKEGHYILIFFKVNTSRKYDNYKHICAKHLSFKIYKANISKIEEKNTHLQ